jgi:hypothetical protein
VLLALVPVLLALVLGLLALVPVLLALVLVPVVRAGNHSTEAHLQPKPLSN